MTIVESVMYADLGNPRSRVRDLGTLNRKKTAIFVSKLYLFACNYKMDEGGTLKFEHNRVQKESAWPELVGPFTILISVIADINLKKFMVFKRVTYHLSRGHVHLFHHGYNYFFFVFLFFSFFFFS